MTTDPPDSSTARSAPPWPGAPRGGGTAPEAPFLRAPEGVRAIFAVTLVAACAPLLAGVVFFGWRALIVVGLCMISCGVIERLYYTVTRTPALLGRTHAYLTGLLLGLTLPAFVDWYVPVLASAFAIIVGKAIFGGVGHFLWQPALVGRLAVAVLLPDMLNPDQWPLLVRSKMVVGDLWESRPVAQYRSWDDPNVRVPDGVHAVKIHPPGDTLAKLTERQRAWLSHFLHAPGPTLAGAKDSQLPAPQFSALIRAPANLDKPPPAALRTMPPVPELLTGARPGGIGETGAIVILVAGLYLVYRNYVRWQLPLVFLLSAAAVAAVAPVQLAGAGGSVRTVWLPVRAEGYDVGLVYLAYHLLTSEIMLAAFFLATEMTTRPVSADGQVIFALGCGTLAMLLKLYIGAPVPAYMAVLVMNTFVPAIDAVVRPRVLGRKLFWRWRR